MKVYILTYAEAFEYYASVQEASIFLTLEDANARMKEIMDEKKYLCEGDFSIFTQEIPLNNK